MFFIKITFIYLIIINIDCNFAIKFKVGGLLPELQYFNKFNQCFKDDKNKWDDALLAINFAKSKLINYFNSYYKCDIDLDIRGTNCDIAYGTKTFFDLANDTKSTLMLFGGSCDIQPIAESVKFFNLTILSYTETNPQFSEQTKYNGFYRLVPSEEQHNQLRIHLVKMHNWKRIGTIYLTKAKYTLAHNMLIRELENQKLVNLTLTRSLNENENIDQYEAILDEFKKRDIYIIIGIFDINTTIKLYCQIYKKQMYGENYQWIILGTSLNNLKNLYFNETYSNCTYDEIIVAMNGTLQTRVVQYSYQFYKKTLNSKYINGNNNNKNSFKGLNSNDLLIKNLTDLYFENYLKNCSSNNKLCFYSSCYHAYAYDLLLTIFKLLGSLIENKKFLCNRDSIFERDINWFRLINEAFNNISFTGVTGHVKFVNGSRIGEIKLEQLRASINGSVIKGNEVLIGIYDQNKNIFYKMNNIIWHNNIVPNDSITKTTHLYKIYTGVYVGMSSIATIGICLAFAFLVFNIRFRSHKFIKMSSPNLNNMIIFGCLLSYMNIYFLGLYEGLVSIKILSQICAVRVWLISIGFTFAFGSMFSKTYRVHAILTNTKLRKKSVIKDYKLFGIVVFLLIIDMIILTSWQIVDPLKIVRKRSDYLSLNKNIIVEENSCDSNSETIWLAILFSYKGLLIIFGCFFAYETRHVTISALNDSRHIGICVYNVLIMCSTGSTIAFIVRNKNIAYVLISLFIFSCTTITLCLVFIPKVLEVYHDPTGKKKHKTKPTFKTTSVKETKYTTTYSNDNTEVKLQRAQSQLNEKRQQLLQLDSKIDILTKQLKINSDINSDLIELIDFNKTKSNKMFKVNSVSNFASSQFLDSKKLSTEDDDSNSWSRLSFNEEHHNYSKLNNNSNYNINNNDENNDKITSDDSGSKASSKSNPKKSSFKKKIPKIKVTNSTGSTIDIEHCHSPTISVNGFIYNLSTKFERKFQSVKINHNSSTKKPQRKARSASMAPKANS